MNIFTRIISKFTRSQTTQSAGEDVEAVASRVMQQSARESENDLANILTDLEKVNEQKNEVRQFVEDEKRQQSKLSRSVRSEYDARTGIRDVGADPVIANVTKDIQKEIARKEKKVKRENDSAAVDDKRADAELLAAQKAEQDANNLEQPVKTDNNKNRFAMPLIVGSIVILLIVSGLIINFKLIPPSTTSTLPPAPAPSGPQPGATMGWIDGSTIVFNGNTWIYRSEVTNYQFSLFVETGSCLPPLDELSTMQQALLNQAQASLPMQTLAQGGGEPCLIHYCEWAGGRIATDAENAGIGVDSGLPSTDSTHGFRCAVDSPHPMAVACQTSAFYLNGSPTPMDHSVTEAGRFCQNGQSFVTLDIAMPEGGSIQSVNGDCQAIGGNRVLCSTAPGSSGDGAALIECNGVLPAVQDNNSPAAGQMQCAPSYEVNGDLPTQCDFNKLLPAVRNDSVPAGAQLQSSQNQLAGQVSLVAFQPNVSQQGCGSGTDNPCPFGYVCDERTHACVASQIPCSVNNPNACPSGEYCNETDGICVPFLDSLPLSNMCLTGFNFDETERCCQSALLSSRYPGCPAGEAYDPSTGTCDSENIYVAGGKVLHPVQLNFNAPSCETKDTSGGNSDCKLSSAACAPQKFDSASCTCY